MENGFDIVAGVVLDAAKDTLYLLPFLLVVYLLLEWLEHKAGKATQDAVRRAGAAGPLVGAVLGAIPQCGFSAMGATLYAGRVITLGTLFAVFLATSDELLPMMIAESAPIERMAAVLLSKVVIGMLMGFAVDLVLRLRHRPQEPLAIHKLCEQDHCECSGDCATCHEHPELTYEHDATIEACECHHHEMGEECDKHEHQHAHQHTGSRIVKSALKHTLQVVAFIFVVSLVLGFVFEFVGEDGLRSIFGTNAVVTVFVSALVGLIPNCAASVAITQLWLEGVLQTGAMMAGLLVSAGVGLLVLCRSNRNARQNAIIIVTLYAIGVAWGLVFLGAGITF